MANDFSTVPGFQDALNSTYSTGVGKYWGQGFARDNSDSLKSQLSGNLNALGEQFSNVFQNTVGRAPTQDELGKFFQENAGQTLSSTPSFDIAGNQNLVRNNIQQYVGDTFQQTAKDYATQQLTAQQGQAQTLANQYRQMGQQSISTTADMLKTYASSLFEKLQPQLLTSLQSQGLLNSGALNEAEAGVQKDLAAQSQGFLANANLNLENQANQIQFGGASAPYYYQQAQYQNQVPYLQNQAAGALNFGNNTFMSNLDYAHQLGLLNAQGQNQGNLAHPGFGSTFTNSFANSFGNIAGQGGQMLGNMGYSGGGGGGGGYSGPMSVGGSQYGPGGASGTLPAPPILMQ